MSFQYIGVKIIWKGKGLKEVGLDSKSKRTVIKIDKRYFRPNEFDSLRGDSKKAKKEIKWNPKISFKELVKEMINYEIKS